MTLVDFYILMEKSVDTAYGFICRLLDKIYQEKQFAYVHTHSQSEAKTLDELLWTFRDDAFIPHCLYGQITEPTPAIQLGFPSIEPKPLPAVFVNLTEEVPDFAFNFPRIIELVVDEKEAKTVARKKYRIYREKNCELNTHDLEKNK